MTNIPSPGETETLYLYRIVVGTERVELRLLNHITSAQIVIRTLVVLTHAHKARPRRAIRFGDNKLTAKLSGFK